MSTQQLHLKNDCWQMIHFPTTTKNGKDARSYTNNMANMLYTCISMVCIYIVNNNALANNLLSHYAI